jgi:hypothetical protein
MEEMNKGEAIFETGRGGPQCCEMSRLPYFLENQLTDALRAGRPSFTFRMIPGTHFC